MAERERRIADLRALGALIREDRRTNGGAGKAGFQALALYRFGVWKDGIRAKLLRIPCTVLYRIAYAFVRNVYGIELPHTARIGRRLLVGHQHGIIVHHNAVIGDDCTIRQGVTIGQDQPTPGIWYGNVPGPKLGDRVEVGAGAIIMGNISVGEGARVGPNAVVMTNVPADAIVVVQPPRVMARPPKRRPKATTESALSATELPAAPQAEPVPEPVPAPAAEPAAEMARKTGT